MKRVFVVDGGLDKSPVQKLDMENGRTLLSVELIGSMAEQSDQLIVIVLKERPERIIFDKMGFGLALYDQFLGKIQLMSVGLLPNGELKY